MSMKQRLSVTSPFAQWLLLTAASMLVGGGTGAHLYSDHRAIDAGERVRMESYGKIVADNLVHQLRSTSSMAKSIRGDLPHLSAQKEGVTLVNRHLQSMSELIPGVRTLFVLDASSTVTASNREELIGQNFREREYFRIARQGGNPDTLYVSAPFKTVLGVFAVTLATVITDEHGAFSGIIGVTLDPEYFNTLLDSVRYVPDVRVSIVHSDGTVFVNSPQLPGVDGMSLAKPGTFFTRHQDSGRRSSLFTGTVYATGDERMMHQRTVEINDLNLDRPFLLAVSRDLPMIFSDWRANAFAQMGGFWLLVLIASAGLYLHQKRQRTFDHRLAMQEVERKRYEEALSLSEKRHRLVADNAKDVIWTMAPDGTITYVSPSVETVRGFTPAEAMQQTIERTLMPASQAVSLGYFTQLHTNLQSGQPPQGFRGELEYRCKDGSTVWTEVMAQPILGDDGSVVEILGVTRDIAEHKQLVLELRQAKDATETANQSLLHANAELARLATTDPLTGVWNRRGFEQVAHTQASQAQRYNHDVSILMFDIDHFKLVNDNFGHQTGDQVLLQLTQLIGRALRDTDVLARWGGEEFVVIMPQCGAPEALLLAEKLRALVAGHSFAEVGTVTVSLGAAHYKSDETLDCWFKRVDLALYEAKAGGRNTVRLGS